MRKLRESRQSLEKYLLYRAERAKAAADLLGPFVSFNRARILDVGCGFGSLSHELAARGASVVGVDTDPHRIEMACRYNGHANIRYVAGSTGSLADQRFDCIVMLDVLEHVEGWARLLAGMRDLLVANGSLYIEYNPYYSLVGHHLYDYTLLPVQFFPFELTRRIVLARRDRGGIFSAENSLRQFRELNRITPRAFRTTCSRNGLELIYEGNEISLPGRRAVSTRIFRNIPFMEDLFTFSHIAILRAIV